VTYVNVRGLCTFERRSAEIIAGLHADIADAIGIPFETWGGRCHEISLAVLRTGIFGRGRVARGTCGGVTSQHSWIVLGDDCYDPDATVVDSTLWSCRPDIAGIWAGRNLTPGMHRPHGYGSCFAGGMPSHHGGPDIGLTPAARLSPAAREFLALLGPLDRRGWGEVAHMGVLDWPAREIITAMYETDALRVLIPVDVAGMITDKNPGNLYW
jgi:hypothetical protein